MKRKRSEDGVFQYFDLTQEGQPWEEEGRHPAVRVASYDIGTRHLGYAAGTFHLNLAYREITAARSQLIDVDCLDILTAVNSKARDARKIPLQRLTEMLTLTVTRHVQAWKEAGPPDYLVVEQQDPGAGKKQYSLTYIIQAIYQSHFSEGGLRVFVYNGRCKMQVGVRGGNGDMYLGGGPVLRDGLKLAQAPKGKEGYRQRKQHGVESLLQFLKFCQAETRVRQTIERHKKKDDMGDALLQAAYAVIHNKAGARKKQQGTTAKGRATARPKTQTRNPTRVKAEDPSPSPSPPTSDQDGNDAGEEEDSNFVVLSSDTEENA